MNSPKNKTVTVTDVLLEKFHKYLPTGISEYDISEICDIPYPTIKSIYQKRSKTISTKTIIKIARGFKINPSLFFDDEIFLSDRLNIE